MRTTPPPRRRISAAAALKVYVPPGEIDPYYLFASGGHSGQVYVYGVPSMRHISTIPVFTPYPATGYGFDDESKKMLGGLTWGDVHHPSLSETNGDYDGRWLFVNEINGRVARIDLRDFKTKQILGPVPNVSGNHGSSFVTPNTEYTMMASRFSVPLPKGTYAPIEKYATEYKGVLAGIKIDPKSGEMSLGWQILTPPFDWDLGDAGKLASDGWMFWSSYNSERATGKLEVTASQRDRDYIAAVDWRAIERVAASGQGDMIGGVRVIDPKKVPGLIYLIPCGKSPHGVDVTPGRPVHHRLGQAAGRHHGVQLREDPDGDQEQGLLGRGRRHPGPQVRVGQGSGSASRPRAAAHAVRAERHGLHLALRRQRRRVLEDRRVAGDRSSIPVAYAIGHLSSAEGDTVNPDGQYLVALNKLSHGRHLIVGPSQPEASQLIDISQEKLKLLTDAFTEPEPHYAQIVKADKIKPIEVYPKEENKHPLAIWDIKDAGVTRQGNKVTVKMVAVRSTFSPTSFEVMEGDIVTVAVTNIEQTTDELHGFGLLDYNTNIVIDPGETKTITFTAKKGVYPYYCTNFCSALHQEMQGYFIVKPR